MQKTRLVPVDGDLALEWFLPMADALVLAAARALGVELVTSDSDFRRVPGARVL